MAKTRYELDTRILAVVFLTAMPFMAFGAYVIVHMAKGQLRESVGLGLEQRAVETKLALERYLGEQIVDLRLVSLDPLIRSAVSPPGLTRKPDDARRLEQAWASGSDPKAVSTLLDSPVSARLRQLVGVQPAFRLVQIVGPTGELVASTGRAGRLQQAETAWFKALADEEVGEQAFIGDMHRLAGSQAVVLEVAYPIRDAERRWRGGVRGLVDASALYRVLAPIRVGRTGHAVLLRSTDGLVLASDESERILRQPFPGFASLQGALEGFPLGEQGEALFGKRSQRRGYWTLPQVTRKGEDGKEIWIEPARLVGFTPVDQIPNVKWVVAVEQDLDEALAPIAGVTRYLWLYFLGAFTTVILLALYFSFKVEKPVIEEELHLHEEHIPSGVHPTER
jgi:hypothetical protein